MATISITIPDDHQRFITSVVRSGRFLSENEVIAEALADLKVREEARVLQIGELRTQVQEGLDQLDRGEGKPWNVEEIKALGREYQRASSQR